MYASALAGRLRLYIDRRAESVAARVLTGACETHGEYLAASAEHRVLRDVRAMIDEAMGELGNDDGG